MVFGTVLKTLGHKAKRDINNISQYLIQLFLMQIVQGFSQI